MYNFYTAFVTISVLVFIAIYNTSYISVVTLGGTVLGCAMIGFCSSLIIFLLRKVIRKTPVRCVLGMAGCGCVIGVTASCLPGWELKPDMETALFLIALCFLVTELNEYALNDRIA